MTVAVPNNGSVLANRRTAALYGTVGALVLTLQFLTAEMQAPERFFIYLAATNIAALGLRTMGMLPAGFVILLLGMGDLSLPELLFTGFTATVVRELKDFRRWADFGRIIYSIASMSIGIISARFVYNLTASWGFNPVFPAPILASSLVLLFNCGLAASLLNERQRPWLGVYKRQCRTVLPWFVAASYLAYLVHCCGQVTGLNAGIVALPILFVVDRGYQLWYRSVTRHRDELAALQMRTIESLAIAIESRDVNTHRHLRRVESYALAIGEDMGLDGPELQSLRIAALLHDVGKLSVPERVLLKPGPLNPAEWEIMQTHAAAGADMLMRMGFPPAIASIVRAHHERWDGTGYPHGLIGQEIPLGSRILAAVDCLDALASDRPYRRRLPMREAIDKILSEKGHAFDPAVVERLIARHAQLERMLEEYDASADGVPARQWAEMRSEPDELPSEAGAACLPAE